MYKHIEFTLKGVSPTMIHSGRLANPLDPITKEMKKVSSKRAKTEDDLQLLADLEWLGCFYASEPGIFEVKNNRLSLTGFGRPNWPGENVERMLMEAARKQKLGKSFAAGVMCEGQFFLDFGENGKGSIEKIFGDPKYRDTRGVKVQQSTVMRTRPIFQQWTLPIRVSYLPNIVDAHQIEQAIETAGVMIGLSDYRPKYGRFTL